VSRVKTIAKDDFEQLDYFADYTDELTEHSDDIATSTWLVPSDSAENLGTEALNLVDDVTVDYDIDAPSPKYRNGVSGAVAINSKITSVFVVGGTLGNTYRLMNRITTVEGRRYSRVMDLVIQRKSEC
jgi:hypothetical protein